MQAEVLLIQLPFFAILDVQQSVWSSVEIRPDRVWVMTQAARAVVVVLS